MTISGTTSSNTRDLADCRFQQDQGRQEEEVRATVELSEQLAIQALQLEEANQVLGVRDRQLQADEVRSYSQQRTLSASLPLPFSAPTGC